MKWIHYDEMFGPTDADTRRAAREAKMQGKPQPKEDPWKGFEDYSGFAYTNKHADPNIDLLKKDAIQHIIKLRKHIPKKVISQLLSQIDSAQYPSAKYAELDLKQIISSAKGYARLDIDSQLRTQELVEHTSPNMIGFFPAYDPNAQHSNFALTQFDTETADRNQQIIEIAGVKVIWNKTAKRFENLPNATVASSQFYRVYNPTDAKYVQTEQVHGKNAEVLAQMRTALGATYSTNWDTSQLKDFEDFAKGTIYTGHNIATADLSWINNRPSGGFMKMEPTWKKSYLDTLHLSTAIFGKGQYGEGRNKLQNLAKTFGVSAEDLGLPAHEGWADSIVNIKVLEKLIQTFENHPAVQEYLAGFDTGNRHSHYLENPDPLHNSGFVTHGITESKSPLGIVGHALNKLRVKTKEKILKDVPAVLGIEAEDYYNGNWDKSSYEERPMSDIMSDTGDIPVTMNDLKTLLQHGDLGAGGQWSLQMEEAIKDLAANAHWGRAHARSQLMRDIKGLSEADKQYFIRNRGFGSDEAHILHEVSALEAKDIQKQRETEYASLERRAKRFLTKAQLGGWSSDLLSEAITNGNLTEEILAVAEFEKQRDEKKAAEHQKQIEAQQAKDAKLEAQQQHLQNQSVLDTWNELERRKTAQQAFEDRLQGQKQDSQRFWAKQDIAQRMEMRDARQSAQKAYRQGYLFHSDLGALEEKAAIGTKAYREELDKLIDRNKKILTVTKALASVPFFNPMQLFDTISNQAHGIQRAAHGILPQFMERPIFRFSNALGNLWGQFRSSVETKYGMASAVAPVAGALSTVGLSMIPGVGPLAAMAGGQALSGGINLASQALGLGARNKINQYGEGIQHRLNLLGMTTSVLGAFIDGLKMCVGLFRKLSGLWSYMPAYTMSTLTGVAWNKAPGMVVADRLLGFQEGTVSNQYTRLAYQQADLYTSGQYNENALVAAARMGIFDLAYAPPGGDVEQQQTAIYDRLYKRIYESGLSKAEVQSQLSLVKNFSPEMASMLERGHGLVKAGYTQYRDYKAFQSMFGYDRLSDAENARVSITSSKWGAAQSSMSQGLALAGSRAYDLLNDLIIKPINKVLWDFARDGKIDWEALVKIINDIIDKLGDINLKGVNWDKLLGMLDPLGEKIKDKLQGIFGPLGQFVTELSMTRIEFHKDKLNDVLFNKAPIGELFSLVTPQKLADEKVTETAKAMDRAEVIAAQVKEKYGLSPEFQTLVQATRSTPSAELMSTGLSKSKWTKLQPVWEKYMDLAADAANGDVSKYRAYRAAIGTFMKDDTGLLEAHDLVNWDDKGINRVLTEKSYKGLVKAGLPEPIAQEMLAQGILEDFAASKGIESGVALFTESGLAVLTEARDLLKNIAEGKQNKVELKIEDKTKGGINVDAEHVFGGAAANMNMDIRRQ